MVLVGFEMNIFQEIVDDSKQSTELCVSSVTKG